MIEEQGRVIAVESGAVWVETLRKSTCSGCSARHGCGQGLMDRLGVRQRRGVIRALCREPLEVGDSVVIGIAEQAMLRGALWVYMVPLLVLLGAATGSSALGLAEPLVVAAGLVGFALSWLLVRWQGARIAQDPGAQPVVLHTSIAGQSGGQ
ncbi:SoxR reducing system RseC family protein [Stutzerimonas tarimensis]|uniref:SoxR reducing system RseC family protein n=1 Tax=Stutzerimonas tarimensis TaxID=1507735 RepID=A0ABV7T7K6_9GAMM